MSNVLQKMLDQLSETDRLVFNRLAEKLKLAKGDIGLLSQEDIKTIRAMETKYASKISQAMSVETSVQPPSIETDTSAEFELLATPFAQYVRQLLARDLGSDFPSEEDAVIYAFENKWLPIDCQDDELALKFYQRFEADILDANQWRSGYSEVKKDAKMSLGLAWFMVVFQLHERMR